MVVTHHVADDLGGLGVLLVELEAHLLHAKQNAAMHRLEAVANVRQGAANDDRHRVVEVRAAHLLFKVDGAHIERAGPGGRGRAVATCAAE